MFALVNHFASVANVINSWLKCEHYVFALVFGFGVKHRRRWRPKTVANMKHMLKVLIHRVGKCWFLVFFMCEN